ncbi:hypothetical protein ACFLYS_01785 [Chloroflexota bacterium]
MENNDEETMRIEKEELLKKMERHDEERKKLDEELNKLEDQITSMTKEIRDSFKEMDCQKNKDKK